MAALITVLQNVGCSAPAQEPTVLTLLEEVQKQAISENTAKRRCGYVPSVETCQGRLSLGYDKKSEPLVMYVVLQHQSLVRTFILIQISL
jgi:hypothetical protein